MDEVNIVGDRKPARKPKPTPEPATETVSSNKTPTIKENEVEGKSGDPIVELEGDGDGVDECNCGRKFKDQGVKGVQCERCLSRFCTKCQNINNSMWKAMTSFRNLHWFCSGCEVTALSLAKKDDAVTTTAPSTQSVKEIIEDSMKAATTRLIQAIDSTKTVLKQSYAEATQGINRKVNDDSPQLRTMMRETLTEQARETEEKERRAGNIVIHGLEESKSNDGRARREQDAKFVRDLCEEALGLQDISIDEVHRLGRFDADRETNRRPLKITFKDRDDKARIQSRLANLKGAHERFRSIRICDDLTKDEQQLVKSKIEEAKNRTAAETSGDWIYLVRGQVPNLRIIKKKKEIRQTVL